MRILIAFLLAVLCTYVAAAKKKRMPRGYTEPATTPRCPKYQPFLVARGKKDNTWYECGARSELPSYFELWRNDLDTSPYRSTPRKQRRVVLGIYHLMQGKETKNRIGKFLMGKILKASHIEVFTEGTAWSVMVADKETQPQILTRKTLNSNYAWSDPLTKVQHQCMTNLDDAEILAHMQKVWRQSFHFFRNNCVAFARYLTGFLCPNNPMQKRLIWPQILGDKLYTAFGMRHWLEKMKKVKDSVKYNSKFNGLTWPLRDWNGPVEKKECVATLTLDEFFDPKMKQEDRLNARRIPLSEVIAKKEKAAKEKAAKEGIEKSSCIGPDCLTAPLH